jgi:hypothetical protein
MQTSFQPISKRVFHFVFSLFVFILFSSVLQAQTCLTNNYAANQTVMTSDGNDLAGNIVDGNITTDWFGGADSKWIYVDLGASQSLCKVTLKWGFWSGVPQTIIQGSNNASTWTDLYTIATSDHGVHAPDNSYDYIDVDLSSVNTAYRYVRLYYASGTSYGPHLKELEVYIKQTTLTPTVSITAPTDGSSMLQGSNLTISAQASEVGGSISKVEFFSGTTMIGQDLSSPYSIIWNNVQAGDYDITAHAHDATGQVASHSITIHVTAPTSGWSLSGNGGLPSGSFLGTTDGNPMVFKTGGLEAFRITPTGQLSIGTVDPKGYKLAVNGDAIFTRIKVQLNNQWADYVFDKNYKLPSFKELEDYINRHHHLPGVQTAPNAEKHGVDVGENQTILLQKIEELTLYIIQMNKNMSLINQQVKKLKQENTSLKKQIQNNKK